MDVRRKKRTQPLSWDGMFTWETAILSSFSSCSGLFSQEMLYWITSVSWERAFKNNSISPSSASFTRTGRRTRNAEPATLSCPLSQERVRKNELLHKDLSVFSFLSSSPLPSYKSCYSKENVGGCPYLSKPNIAPGYLPLTKGCSQL